MNDGSNFAATAVNRTIVMLLVPGNCIGAFSLYWGHDCETRYLYLFLNLNHLFLFKISK